MVPLLLLLLAAPSAFAADSYESIPPDEADAAATITKTIDEQVVKDKQETGSAHRDAHMKAHGCVKARFTVEPSLPPELQQGVFQAGRAYPAWIRFSNGSGKSQNDAVDDARGMAVKLMGVPGDKLADEKATQDFLMISGPVFFVRNAADYVEFTTDAAAGKPMRFFFRGANPFRWRMHELRAALNLLHRRTSNPLHARYWSVASFLMGASGPAKFSARPCVKPRAGTSDTRNPDFLRAAMAKQLKDSSACFEFMAQLQTQPDKMPVEDPTIEWKEKLSPFRKVATIDIPAQTFDSPAQRKFCEELSMNPWHAVAEHRPLGGINRVRRVVYAAISTLRHGLNGAARVEPTGEEKFE
ncbi:MAG TPA: catalase family protein [Elusimicrobiota bacterium]|nr:catalase family protein [Elusimicrobiota bacterium]